MALEVRQSVSVSQGPPQTAWGQSAPLKRTTRALHCSSCSVNGVGRRGGGAGALRNLAVVLVRDA